MSAALNGSNVSSGLVITGSSSNKNVFYTGLASNTVYNASITVTDSLNLTASASAYFETTWVGVPPVLYLWEAEDYDFNGGKSIDNPILCSTVGTTNCYYGKTGTPDADYHYVSVPPARVYRAGDLIGSVLNVHDSLHLRIDENGVVLTGPGQSSYLSVRQNKLT